ncbi:MAG: hypothetical protein JRI43_08340 [Deltaproteobacteria bacterium]|nr:hypothetical protein [Deltaproteobacteria bacterium]
MDKLMNLKERVSETIARYRMTEQGDLLVVAVSGGPDSMCLLDTLNQRRGGDTAGPGDCRVP